MQPEAQRPDICMAKASDFIQHGEGILGLNYSGEKEFGAIISSIKYGWSIKGDVELTGDRGLMKDNALFDSRCGITWECYMRETGTEIPHPGDMTGVQADVLNLCIRNSGRFYHAQSCPFRLINAGRFFPLGNGKQAPSIQANGKKAAVPTNSLSGKHRKRFPHFPRGIAPSPPAGRA